MVGFISKQFPNNIYFNLACHMYVEVIYHTNWPIFRFCHDSSELLNTTMIFYHAYNCTDSIRIICLLVNILNYHTWICWQVWKSYSRTFLVVKLYDAYSVIVSSLWIYDWMESSIYVSTSSISNSFKKKIPTLFIDLYCVETYFSSIPINFTTAYCLSPPPCHTVVEFGGYTQLYSPREVVYTM